MWSQASSIVRFCAMRIQCLILAKTCSIGLRSGEYGGRYHSLAPAFRYLPDGRRLVATEIIHDDDVARFEHGDELLFDIGAEAFAVDRSVEHARGSELVTA